METLKASESKSCEVSLGLSEVQLPQIPGIQKLVTDFCPPVAELVLRVNSPDCRFDPLAKKFSSVRFPVSPGKESIVTPVKISNNKVDVFKLCRSCILIIFWRSPSSFLRY